MPDPDFHFLGRELGTLIALLSTKEAEADALRNVLEGLRHGRGRSPTGEALDHLLEELEKWNIELERAEFARSRNVRLKQARNVVANNEHVAVPIEIPASTKPPTADMTIIPKHLPLPPRLSHG
jgi:hypothetical protein